MGLVEEMTAIFVVGWVLGFVAGRGSGKAQALSLILQVGAVTQARKPGPDLDLAALQRLTQPAAGRQ